MPPRSLLTRRFGVSQTARDAVMGQVTKVRPIDDFTESLANLTNSGNETIAPHGIDIVVSSVCVRIREKWGRKPNVFARTIDLRKAYKQLPLLEAAMKDAFLCVYNPETSSREEGIVIRTWLNLGSNLLSLLLLFLLLLLQLLSFFRLLLLLLVVV